jgi:ankyrin repeat protein
MNAAFETLAAAIKANDTAAVARTLAAYPELEGALDAPLPDAAFGQTPLLAAVAHANRDMVDALLRAGANINQKSHWWAGGFHVLDDAWQTPWMASYLIGRGAVPEIHHVVRLGMVEDVRRMLAETPALIHARGGDGQLPLHFAQTVTMADFLIDRGADLDARDVDHESTAAQWMIRDRPEVARSLVSRGAATDLLMASALGQADVVARMLDSDPPAIRTAVNPIYFPMQDPRAGGSIYIWTLGANKTAPIVAREFGHDAVFRLLMDAAPAPLQFAVACAAGDDDLAQRLLAASPDLVAALEPEDLRTLPDAARDRNFGAVMLMVKAGWPLDARGQHNATALHWAAYNGDATMARLLLLHGAPVDIRGDDYHGTPLDWALHGAKDAARLENGDYPGTIEVLRMAAGGGGRE